MSGFPGSPVLSGLSDLTGRTALVTGANSGLGLHATVGLCRLGARVLMACRDAGRGAAALDRVRQQCPGADARLVSLDLADLAAVRAAVQGLAEVADLDGLDLLVNNAGVMAPPRRRTTADGHELQWGTNHLGHFALTGLLWPRLLASGSPRVVTVSSNAHHLGRTGLPDAGAYRPWRVYGQSKLANLLFAMQLQRVADRAGVDLVSVAAHPGFAATELVGNGPAGGARGPVGRLLNAVTSVVAQPAEAGAWPLLVAAADPSVRGAEYVGPSGPGGWRGTPVRTTAAPAAYDVDLAAALWRRSEELTGVRFAG